MKAPSISWAAIWALAFLSGFGWIGSARGQAVVSMNTTSSGKEQTIDGFGTCTAGTMASWCSNLYLNDMYCSMVRVDLSPSYVAPYSNNSYNSPAYGVAGPDGNYVRTYTGASTSGSQPYTASFNGHSAKIAVMSSNITSNIALLQFNGTSQESAGQLAQTGQGSSLSQLGDFKLFGSFWSPPPWVKVTSGNTFPSGSVFTDGPSAGSAYPFLWDGCFGGGWLDVSGTALSQFNNTSALQQFAWTVSAELRGFQNYYGVKFYAISIQNELNYEEFYNSCQYPSSSNYIATLEAVRTELNNYPDLAGIQIEGPEDLLGSSQYDLWQYSNPTTDKGLKFVNDVAANTTAAPDLSFYSIHGYDDSGTSSTGSTTSTSWNWWTNGWTSAPGALPKSVNGFTHYGKKSWMTESSGETTGWLDSSGSGYPDSGAFSIAVKLYEALTAGQESAWVYWQMNDGTTPADGSSLTDENALSSGTKYVAAKHFFRYIRPNSYRVSTSVANSSAVLASSFVNDGNLSLTTVLINNGSTAATATVNVPTYPPSITNFSTFTSSNGSYWQPSTTTVSGGQTDSISLPAYSVATLTAVGSWTYNAWANYFFGNTTTTGATTATPENDAEMNLLKYACDVKPTETLSTADKAALPSTALVTVSGTQYLATSFRENHYATDLTVTLETSTDLKNWSPVTGGNLLSQTVGTDQVTGDPIMEMGVATTGGAKQFIRLDASISD